jgi:hypothetical protein
MTPNICYIEEEKVIQKFSSESYHGFLVPIEPLWLLLLLFLFFAAVVSVVFVVFVVFVSLLLNT